MKFHQKYTLGFTLIELLIVIAIIGMLAAIIIPNIIGARVKATQAKQMAEIKGIQTQAQLYYDTVGSYLGMCDAPPNVNSQVIYDFMTSASVAPDSQCVASATSYAMQAILSQSNPNVYFCIDALGYSGKGQPGVAFTITDYDC